MSRFDDYCRRFRPSVERISAQPLQIIITVQSCKEWHISVPTVPEIDVIGTSLQDALDKLSTQASSLASLFSQE